MKKSLLVTLAVFSSVMILILAAYLSIDGLAKSILARYLSEISGVKVGISDMDVSIRSGDVRISGFTAENVSGFSKEPAFSCAEMLVSVDPSTFFDDVVRVREISIVRPEIRFDLSLKGSNLEVIRNRIRQNISNEIRDGRKKMIVDQLVIDDARVSASIPALSEMVISVVLSDVALEDIGADSGGATLGQVSNAVLADVAASILDTVGLSPIMKAGEVIRDGARSLQNGAKSLFDKVRGLIKMH